eukprot:GHVL01010936.1.p1 GENE.GHVL01010936.1~~GHVL01010936.1.p1  ORF type:complete len:236 (+),score=55.63 GHVL01010936.1:65-772(+)
MEKTDSAAIMMAKLYQRKAQMYCELAQEASQDLGLTWSISSIVKSRPLKVKADPNRPKKPKSSYFIFCDEQRALCKAKGLTHVPDIKELAEKWKNLDETEKQKFEKKGRKLRDVYDDAIAKYKETGSPNGATSTLNAAKKKTALAPGTASLAPTRTIVPNGAAEESDSDSCSESEQDDDNSPRVDKHSDGDDDDDDDSDDNKKKISSPTKQTKRKPGKQEEKEDNSPKKNKKSNK